MLLRLYLEFAKVGLFAVGGGLATIPFLQAMGETSGWFSNAELTTMIAVSESTPGPIGVNMATYVGMHTAGVAGAVAATLGLVTPSILIILMIAGFLEKFRRSRAVEAVFYGLRPASTALITAAGVSVAGSVLVLGWTGETITLHWPSLLLAVLVFFAMRHLKEIHPIVWIALSAAAGVLFRF